MNIESQKIRAVTSLAGPKRYSHFIKVAADLRSVWGLYKDGWALSQDADGRSYFPVWPAEAYAVQCATSEWESYEPREIDLDDLVDELFPKLRSTRTGLAVFPTPDEKGVTPELEVVEADLRLELSRIE